MSASSNPNRDTTEASASPCDSAQDFLLPECNEAWKLGRFGAIVRFGPLEDIIDGAPVCSLRASEVFDGLWD